MYPRFAVGEKERRDEKRYPKEMNNREMGPTYVRNTVAALNY
jgi:hypothetical protein